MIPYSGIMVCMQIFHYMVYIWEVYEKEMEQIQSGISKLKDFKYLFERVSGEKREKKENYSLSRRIEYNKSV